MNATAAAPARAKRAPSKERAGPVSPTQAASAALNAIADFLDAATLTDEVHQTSGDSDRLLRSAEQIARLAADMHRTPEDCEQVAHDVAALIRAARLVPGDTESTERSAFIESAAGMLKLLAGATLDDMCTPLAPRPTLPMKHKTIAPATAGGFNATQFKTILEVVAGRTRTLQQLIMQIQGDDDADQGAINLDAACIIATSIGAMADEAVGHGVIGGHDVWNYGPFFADEGKEQRA